MNNYIQGAIDERDWLANHGFPPLTDEERHAMENSWHPIPIRIKKHDDSITIYTFETIEAIDGRPIQREVPHYSLEKALLSLTEPYW